MIIKESDVDELCRVVTTLAEDVRSQMVGMNVPQVLLTQLLKGLDRTVSDAQERLSYCAEIRLRQHVQLFEPSKEDLAYPEILQKRASSSANASSESSTAPPPAASSSEEAVVPAAATERGGGGENDDVSKTWYPPLRQTLALLSKLYGVVEPGVFEDFARRAVDFCVQTLKAGSAGVKKRGSGSSLHGDLFLVRHLLVLREQLLPFEIRLQGVERQLDFRSTGAALKHLVMNSRALFRFDMGNGLMQLAREGIPTLQESQVDAKRELDAVLKVACR